MPWGPDDAKRFTKKASSSKSKRQWSAVADSVLARGVSESKAIRSANSVVKREAAKRSRKSRRK